jgi:hypothetical protein
MAIHKLDLIWKSYIFFVEIVFLYDCVKIYCYLKTEMRYGNGKWDYEKLDLSTIRQNVKIFLDFVIQFGIVRVVQNPTAFAVIFAQNYCDSQSETSMELFPLINQFLSGFRNSFVQKLPRKKLDF